MLKYRAMIDFQLTEDHDALVQTVREFAQKEVAPYIKEWDEKQEAHPEIFKKMAELNLLGVCIPEQYGGAGFDYISLGLVCEELEACDTFLRVAMSVHVGLNSLSVYSWGTEEQKQKYLVPQAKGEKIATFGLTEPNAGKIFLFLLFGSPAENTKAVQPDVHRHRHSQKRVARFQLLAHKTERDVIKARSTVLFGNAYAEQSKIGHLIEYASFEMGFFIPFLDMRRHLAVAKLADGLLQCQMFFGQFKIDHG